MSWTTVASLAVGATVALGLLWGLWLHEGDAVTTSGWTPITEEGRQIAPELAIAPANGTFEETYTWEVTLDLPSPGTQRVVPHLPWRQEVSPWGSPGATLFVSMTLNGERLHAAEHRNTAGSGLWATTTPDPEALAGADLVSAGNTLVIEATVTREARNGSAVVALGPAAYEIVSMDTDGDGLPDTDQPLSWMHTGLLTGPLALLGGIGASRTTRYLVDRARDRWRTRG